MMAFTASARREISMRVRVTEPWAHTALVILEVKLGVRYCDAVGIGNNTR